MSPRPTGRLVATASGTDLVLERSFRAPIADVWRSVTHGQDDHGDQPHLVGGWAVYQIPSEPKVDVSQLKHMCVDGADAYVPNQTWPSGTTTCTCSKDLEKLCD